MVQGRRNEKERTRERKERRRELDREVKVGRYQGSNDGPG